MTKMVLVGHLTPFSSGQVEEQSVVEMLSHGSVEPTGQQYTLLSAHLSQDTSRS